MQKPDLDFATLIGSRICHDLISPIGAVNNGLELLSMSGVSAGPEMELIGQSVGSASAKIRFFRVAFGAAADQKLGQAEVASILRDLYSGSRWSANWVPADPHPRAEVRCAFLALMCLETALAYGGQMSVDRDDQKWRVTGTAEKLMVDPDLWSHLAKPARAGSLKPAHVQFGLLPTLTQDSGRKLMSKVTETEITVTF